MKKCLDAWNDNKGQTEDLKSKITILSGKIALSEKELENITNLFDEKQKEKQDIETDKRKLFDERKKLFGEKSVEEEERRLKKLIEDYEAEKAKAEKREVAKAQVGKAKRPTRRKRKEAPGMEESE